MGVGWAALAAPAALAALAKKRGETGGQRGRGDAEAGDGGVVGAWARIPRRRHAAATDLA